MKLVLEQKENINQKKPRGIATSCSNPTLTEIVESLE